MKDENYFTEATIELIRSQVMLDVVNNMTRMEVSSKELAELTGMKEETINRILSGRIWPNMKQYIIILEALNLTIGNAVQKM